MDITQQIMYLQQSMSTDNLKVSKPVNLQTILKEFLGSNQTVIVVPDRKLGNGETKILWVNYDSMFVSLRSNENAPLVMAKCNFKTKSFEKIEPKINLTEMIEQKTFDLFIKKFFYNEESFFTIKKRGDDNNG